MMYCAEVSLVYVHMQGVIDPAVKEALVCIIQSKKRDRSDVF